MIMETLCLRNASKRYIVSFRNRVLILTHDYNVAIKYMNFVNFAKNVLGDKNESISQFKINAIGR
jgi:hypothetical protein